MVSRFAMFFIFILSSHNNACIPKLINTSNYHLDYLTVPMKSTGSWGMMASLLRRSSRPICAILIPSMVIEPPVSSTSLNRATPREDFPANTYRKDTAWRNVCARWKSGFRNKLECCWLEERKGHLYLILCVPQYLWSPQAGWWRTDSSAQVADHHDNASLHPGRWSFPAEAKRGQERLPQGFVEGLHSPDTEIRDSDGILC